MNYRIVLWCLSFRFSRNLQEICPLGLTPDRFVFSLEVSSLTNEILNLSEKLELRYGQGYNHATESYFSNFCCLCESLCDLKVALNYSIQLSCSEIVFFYWRQLFSFHHHHFTS